MPTITAMLSFFASASPTATSYCTLPTGSFQDTCRYNITQFTPHDPVLQRTPFCTLKASCWTSQDTVVQSNYSWPLGQEPSRIDNMEGYLSMQHIRPTHYQTDELQSRCEIEAPVGSYTRTCSRQPATLYVSSDARLAHAAICQIAVACTTVHREQPSSLASQRHNLFYMLNHATARVSLENRDGFFVTEHTSGPKCQGQSKERIQSIAKLEGQTNVFAH